MFYQFYSHKAFFAAFFFFKKWHMYAPNHTDNEEIRKKVIIYKQEVEVYLSGKALALQAQSNEFHP